MPPSHEQLVKFRDRLLRWFAANARDLPWRRDPTPYRVWVSEVMLQQTVVGTVSARYEAWLARFPDIPALARAERQEVLGAWEGMGYYNRARRLHEAARVVVERHGGRLPCDRAALRALPGVGPYIAAAVRSLAFGEDDLALDANLLRVFMRLLGIRGRASAASTRKDVAAAARAALPAGRSSDYNQALMDFGSLVCRPREPNCAACFAADLCVARREGRQSEIPERRRKTLERIRTAVAVFRDDAGRLYLQQRPESGLFAGMWEFPGGKVEAGETPREAVVREVREELGTACAPGAALPAIVHYYTVFEVTLHAFLCPPPGGLPVDATHRWVERERLADHPMPSANRKLLAALRRHEAAG